MKGKLILLFAGVLAAISVSAQHTFSLQEMQNFTSKGASDFETSMLESDYSLQNKLSDKESKVYLSDKASPDGKKYKMVRRQVTNSKVVEVTFYTTDKKYYIALKKDLASKGFKAIKNEEVTVENVPATKYHFFNAPMNIILCTYTTDASWYTVQAYVGSKI
jgi:hypothetical protein